jgi:hypothetical protein
LLTRKRSYGSAQRFRRVTGQLSENVPICNNPSKYPFSRSRRRPEPVSEISVAQPDAVPGFCDAPPHELPDGLRPGLHHRPTAQLQVDALQRAGCHRVFVETASGARSDRPTLAQLLDQLRPSDTLVVWKLDRLGRSLRHLVDTVTGLADRGIGFRSLQEAIDTTTPGGKLVFAALAEFERDLIRERTSAGLAAARARGRHGGRHRC